MNNKENSAKENSVLIVDDNVNNLQVLGATLRDEGYKVLIAKNGKMAISIVYQYMPDIILLDIMMPEMNGYETAKRLKSDRETELIPIIFMSAKNDEDSIIKGFDSGGQDYVSKPFIQKELIARVETHLKISKNEKNLARIIEAKDQFFAHITSLLKAPLSRLASFSEMLPEKLREENYLNAIEYANIIYQTSLEQFKTFENLLEWARIQTGHYTPFFEDVDTAGLINNLVEMFQSEIKQKKLAISTTFDSKIAFSDKKLLSTVLRNILSNAINFSRPNGKIEITSTEDEDKTQIKIKDYGEGMTVQEAEALFSDKTDLSTINRESDAKGNCMGVKIAKELTKTLDGEIHAAKHNGDGIEITISLPVGF